MKPKMKPEITADQLHVLLIYSNIRPGLFKDSRCYTEKDTAQDELKGRNFYATDGALRSFKARILDTHCHISRCIFSIVESLPLYGTGPRVYRFRVFDISGSYLNRDAPGTEGVYPTAAAVRRAWNDWMARHFPTEQHGIDHTLQLIADTAHREVHLADQLREQFEKLGMHMPVLSNGFAPVV